MHIVRTKWSGFGVPITWLVIGGLVAGAIGSAPPALGQSDPSPVAVRVIEPGNATADKSPSAYDAPPQSPSGPAPGNASPAKDAGPVSTMTLRGPATIDTQQPALDRRSAEPGKSNNDPPKPVATRDAGPVEIETASFKGVTPGVTSIENLEKSWGTAKEVRKQGGSTLYLYSVGPFKRVEVVCFADKVSSILIRFDKVYPAAGVAEQLELSRVRPVLVSNELGEILGQAFPERGVLLAFEPAPQTGKASMNVSQIILEPVSAEPFVLRAETNLDRMALESLHDLDQAVKLQPGLARAHWLRARLLASLGDAEKALAASAEAVRLEPGNPQFHVTQAQLLGQLGQFAPAIQEAEGAVKSSDKRPHVKARALCLLGDLTASSTPPEYRKAIGYHMDAVKLADSLAADPHPAIRLAAKEVLIDAHLGAAHDIAWGAWKEKEKAVTRWLQRAALLADDLIKTEQAGEGYRLRVATRALAACVGARGEVDPTPWAEDVLKVGKNLLAASDDAARKAQIRWDLGTALYDALQVYQIRGQHDTAMRYGELAIQYLDQDKSRMSASAAYLLGRIYFRVGAVYALRDQNHRTAVTWFEKAIPLLEKPLPPEALPDLGRHGETFVSMGVSYWESGQREQALRLTQAGIALMEDAVKRGLLDEKALPVAYGNMATMYRHLGQNDPAERFDSMAARIKQTSQR
jgi:tetratricopeptide (TPR) repeat protein